MHEERMKILEMLESGKVNAEEAKGLLEALGQKEEAGSEKTGWGGDFFWGEMPFNSDFSKNMSGFEDCFKSMFNEDFFAQCFGKKQRAKEEKQEV
jgi:hypothetical protein